MTSNIRLASAFIFLTFTSGCSEPVQQQISWDQAMRLDATEANLYVLTASEIGRQRELVDVLNALSTLRSAWAFVDQLVAVEETGFLEFCDIDEYPFERVPYPNELTFQEVVNAASEVDAMMIRLRAEKGSACHSYKRMIESRLLAVSATLPAEDWINDLPQWRPAHFTVLNNSADAISGFAVEWVIRVRGRQAAVAHGKFRFDIVGGLEPGESITKTVGASSRHDPGFSKSDYDAIREAAEIFGPDQLQIESCAAKVGRRPYIGCRVWEREFQDGFEKLNRNALNLHQFQSGFYIRSPAIIPNPSA